MPWQSTSQIEPKQFKCGFCGFNVAANKGYYDAVPDRRIYPCPNCDRPTYFEQLAGQVPGVAPGSDVAHVPPALDKLYREARNCCAVSAYTASVLASRKMLMNIAVEQKAPPGAKFIEYVDYLAANGYIPPNGKGWVDHIRKKGNEATHEIALMGQGEAEELILFVEMLLRFIYEFPSRVPGP